MPPKRGSKTQVKKRQSKTVTSKDDMTREETPSEVEAIDDLPLADITELVVQEADLTAAPIGGAYFFSRTFLPRILKDRYVEIFGPTHFYTIKPHQFCQLRTKQDI
jgi:hypothetical protein